ncbi:hypothetical protein RFI_00699, partial [Reticulomyxa filosa]
MTSHSKKSNGNIKSEKGKKTYKQSDDEETDTASHTNGKTRETISNSQIHDQLEDVMCVMKKISLCADEKNLEQKVVKEILRLSKEKAATEKTIAESSTKKNANESQIKKPTELYKTQTEILSPKANQSEKTMKKRPSDGITTSRKSSSNLEKQTSKNKLQTQSRKRLDEIQNGNDTNGDYQ